MGNNNWSPNAGDQPTSSPSLECKFSRFLDLPGEIRNLIYALAAEQKDAVALQHRHKDIKWAAAQRQFLGLTQTNKQIRAEFLPIYLMNLEVQIVYYEMDQYLSTFVHPQIKNGQADNVVGNITIIVETDFTKNTDPVVDILPLVKLHNPPDRLTVRFLADWPGWEDEPPFHEFDIEREESIFRALFNVHRNPVWSDFLSTAICHILVNGTTYVGPSTEIVVKKEYEEDWMQYPEDSVEGRLGRSLWCQRVGFTQKDADSSYYRGVSVEGKQRLDDGSVFRSWLREKTS